MSDVHKGTTRPDTRIAFGARCSWWGTIYEVSKGSENGTGLPLCPHCRGVLYEEPDMASWDRRLARVPANQFPDYAAVMRWQRETGRRCVPSYKELRAAYDAREISG